MKQNYLGVNLPKTISSEKLAISILSKEWGKDIKLFKHLTILDPTSSYDVEIDGIKIDVKYANYNMNRKKKNLWDFDLRYKTRKNKDYCDGFVLLGMINNVLLRAYYIPILDITAVRKLSIPVFGKSKWNKFLIKEANGLEFIN